LYPKGGDQDSIRAAALATRNQINEHRV